MMHIVIHSSFCTLHFMLRACRPMFAKIALMMYKVDFVFRNGSTIVHTFFNV
jgi:hypothetical protein